MCRGMKYYYALCKQRLALNAKTEIGFNWRFATSACPRNSSLTLREGAMSKFFDDQISHCRRILLVKICKFIMLVSSEWVRVIPFAPISDEISYQRYILTWKTSPMCFRFNIFFGRFLAISKPLVSSFLSHENSV